MKKMRCIVGILVLGLLLTGCGKAGLWLNQERETETDGGQEFWTEENDYTAQYQSLAVNDLFAGNWNRGELTSPEHFMTFTDYLPEIFPQNEVGEKYNRGFFADSKYMYSLDTYYNRGDDGLYYDTHYLNILDCVTREVRTITYRAEQEILGLMMMGPYKTGGRVFASHFFVDEEGVLKEFCMVELLEDGTVNRMQNLGEILREKQMLPEPYCVPDAQIFYEPANDRYYLISPEGDCLYPIDREGNLIAGAEEEGAKDIYLLAASEEGRLIFAREDGDAAICFSYKGEEKQILFSGKDGIVGGIGASTIDGHGRMLFSYKTAVIEWDTVSGTQERLFVDNTMDESYNYQYLDCVMRNEKGEILTLRDNQLRIMTAKGPAKKVTVKIKPMLYFDDSLKRAVRKYEQTHPGIDIVLEAVSAWETRNRDTIELVQEMAKGEGPDLLLLDREEMLSFDKNECLMDLSEMLVPSTRKQLVPGVEDYGRTEHGIMLLSYQPRIRTAIVNRKYVREGDSWTVQDLVDIIEQREKEGKPFELLTRGDYHPFFLFVNNICDSEFVDLKAGTCSFDSELFRKVLEICKRYNKPVDYQEDAYRQMRDGEILTMTPVGMSVVEYSLACANLGEEFVTVGYPTLSGNGNSLDFSMGFAVNRNTENREVIADFINWMFSLENEALLQNAPIRKDLYEGRVIRSNPEDGWSSGPYIRLSGREVCMLASKPDGSSYVPEYLELVEGCRYAEDTTVGNEIVTILWEEADGFFEGADKSAEETAQVIQSRVRLYLQENR